MGNCCLEFYAVLSQSEYEVIEDDTDDRCRAYSSVTNSTYHSEVFLPEYNVPDNSIFPAQFSKFYQIGALVGVGTTSKVYKVHSKFGKRTEGWEEEALVCKIVDKQKLTFDVEDQDVETLLDQLSKEVEILKRIKHQNIVQFYDFMESKDRLFIITERLDGGELFDYILDNGPLSEGFARQILFGVFSAVAYLHERGVVHRDIKAENLIFCKDVNGDIALKLIDFGFSTVLRHAMTGSFMGTGGYIAPEIRQNKIYSTSVDSWSLGVLLYCTLAARLPFGISLDQLPSSLKDCRGAFELVFPTKTWAKVSDPCKDLISKLLEIDPNRRYTVKQALAHPWFQEEYRRAKFTEAQKPTRSLSSDTLAECALGVELPMLRPHLRPTLSMSAIERRDGEFGAYRNERTFSIGDYEVVKTPEIRLSQKSLSQENILKHERNHRIDKWSPGGGTFAHVRTRTRSGSSGSSGCSSSGEGLTDPLTLSSNDESAPRPQQQQQQQGAMVWEEAHSPVAGELFYSSYQHGASSSQSGPHPHISVV